MHERQSGRVPDLGLGERKLVAVVGNEADNPQSRQQLAKQVTDPRYGLTLTDVEEPFPQRGFIDQRRIPDCTSNSRSFHQFQDAMPRDINQPARRQSPDAMVHGFQDENVEIAEIARDQVGHDLPFPVFQKLVAACEAFEHQTDILGSMTFADDVHAGCYGSRRPYDIVEQAPFIWRKWGELFELARQQVFQGTLPGMASRAEGRLKLAPKLAAQ